MSDGSSDGSSDEHAGAERLRVDRSSARARSSLALLTWIRPCSLGPGGEDTMASFIGMNV